jgi:SAM-dependent methyltransferase
MTIERHRESRADPSMQAVRPVGQGSQARDSTFLMTWEQAVRWLREQPEKQDLVKACYYDDPLEDAALRYWESSEWRALRKQLPLSKGKVLDVGAGRGVSSFAFARDGWNVTALEPDASDLVGHGAIRHLVAATGASIAIIEEWGELIPFGNDEFDMIHCRQVLHHARDLKGMLREIGRVLKTNGCFIATREHVISRREDLELFLDSHPLHRLYGGENAYLLSEYIDAISGGSIRVDKILNPFASDINLFPGSRADIKKILARRFSVPFPALIPDWVVTWYGARSNEPGRPYTFVGRKI